MEKQMGNWVMLDHKITKLHGVSSQNQYFLSHQIENKWMQIMDSPPECWHLSPKNGVLHVHLYVSPSAVHWPEFIHGWDRQTFPPTTSQVAPLKLSLHLQLKVSPEAVQLPWWRHGEQRQMSPSMISHIGPLNRGCLQAQENVAPSTEHWPPWAQGW